MIAIAWTQINLAGIRPVYAFAGYLVIGLLGLSCFFLPSSVDPPRLLLLGSWSVFAFLLVRTLASAIPALAEPDLFILLGSFLIYLITAYGLTGFPARLWIVAGLTLLAAADLVIGYVQFTTGNNYLPFGFVRPDYGNRASGFYVCPNHLAGFLDWLSALLLAVTLFARISLWVRVITGYAALLTLTGVILTGSRGGWLSAAAGLVFLLLYALYHWQRTFGKMFSRVLIAVSVALGLAVGTGLFFGSQSNLLRSRWVAIGETRDVRPLLWQAAWRQFTLAPAIGTGAGSYQVYGRLYRNPLVQYDPGYAHNDYLQLLGEFGAVGAGLIVLFLVGHLLCPAGFVLRMTSWLQREGRVQSSSFALTLGALAAVIMLLVHSVLDFNLQIPANALMVGFLFGILANPGVRLDATDPENRLSTKPVLWRWLVAAGAVALLALVLSRRDGAEKAEKARLAFNREVYALAVYWGKLAIAAQSRDPDVYYYVGESRRQLANGAPVTLQKEFLADALEAFRAGIRIQPSHEALLVKAGLAAAQLGRFKEADDEFRAALTWDPNLGQIYAFYGTRFLLEKRYAEAATAFQTSNRLDANQIATKGLDQTAALIKVPSRGSPEH